LFTYNSYILMFVRMFILFAFAASFLGKVGDIRGFQETIVDFQLLSTYKSKIIALMFLSAELLTSLMMLIGGDMLILGFLLAIILLIIFSIALISALKRKVRVNCNCFGQNNQRISIYDTIRNLLLILSNFVGIWAYMNASLRLSWEEVILVSCIAACFVVLVTNLSDIVETLRKPFHAFNA
jgi:Methylamine utilisation protein MauE